MSLSNEQHEFAKDVSSLLHFIHLLGIKHTLGEVFRTPEQQAIYFAAGKSWKKFSGHQNKLAIDINFFPNGKYIGTFSPETGKALLTDIGGYWCSLHPKNRWGGNYSLKYLDLPHFERLR